MIVQSAHVTPKYIRSMFGSDPDLMEKYHIEAGKGLNRIVSRTVRDLHKCDQSFQFYVVKDELGKHDIGFFGSEYKVIEGFEVRYLSTIFVHPDFRNPDVLSVFWAKIKSHFENKRFFSGLYEKNTRAAEFYLRNGAYIIGKLKINNEFVLIFDFGDNYAC